MSILDTTLARTPGASDTVIGLSRELGMDPALVEKALMVLTQCYTAQGDTMTLAATKTGVDTTTLNKIVSALGGEAALASLADNLSGGLGDLGRGDFFKDLLPFG
ncbi:MAG: hypothetical protein AAF291_02810 [Pseudomonadota bacterium]